MAEIIRIDNFFGGISSNERDRRLGMASNLEEMDIFSNAGYLEPTTIFGDEAGITRKIQAYDLDDGDTAYAYGQSADGDAEVWALTTASATNPGTWSSVFESTADVHPNADIAWFKYTTGEDYLFYPTISSTTVTLKKLGDLSTYIESTVGVLDGLDATGDRVHFARGSGELYVTNGRYIASVANDGTFTQHALTLPSEMVAVSLAFLGEFLYILCKNTNTGVNSASLFAWDRASDLGWVDRIEIPMGNPQWLANFRDVLYLSCAKDGIFKIFGVSLGENHVTELFKLNNIQEETAAQPVSPNNTVFTSNNALYFGLWKTDKSGLYAIGQSGEGYPLALILAKRFTTTDYSLHTPYAANKFGNNWYVSFDDNTTATAKRIEGNNSPTRSSNAVYESVWLDAKSPENVKDFNQVRVLAKPLAASCEIKIDFSADNAAAYDTNSLKTFTPSNDTVTSAVTANTYWVDNLTSVAGRLIKLRIRFTSSGTSKPTLYSVTTAFNTRPV